MKNLFTNNIKKIVLILILLIVIILAFSLYFSIKAKNQVTTSRTVMIYMVGADLESTIGMATRDLKDVSYRKTKANHVHVILIAGGTTSWQNNYIDVNESSIYSLEESGFEKIDIRDRENMGDTNNLNYFLNYVYDNYKSDKYDFIYWNHGGGVDGSEYDEFTSDHLTLANMRDAFDNSPFQEDNKLEFLFFRTCLNGTVEIANIYQKYADYMIASEEIAYVTNIDSLLRVINEIKPSDTPVEIGKKEVDIYKRLIAHMCDESLEKYCVDSTYSVIDLSKINDLNNSINEFSMDLLNELPNRYEDFAKIRSNMSQYADDIPYYDMVDLYDFTENFDSYSTKGTLVRDAIEQAVIYNWSNTSHSHGLSIYFPYHNQMYLNIYSDIASSSTYSNFISSFYKVKNNTPSSSYSTFSNSNAMIAKKEEEAVDVTMELTSDEVKDFSKASYMVFADTKDGYYEMIYQGEDVKLEDNTLKANVKGKLLRLSDFEYEDDSGFLSLREIEVQKDYIDLRTVAVLSMTNSMFYNKNFTAYLTIRLDKEHPNGYIQSIYTYLEDENMDKKVDFAYTPVGIHLTDYPFISLISTRYKILDEFGNYNPNWKMESSSTIRSKTFKTDEIKFIKEDFSSNYDYYVVFKVTDLSNQEYYSLPIKLK